MKASRHHQRKQREYRVTLDEREVVRFVCGVGSLGVSDWYIGSRFGIADGPGISDEIRKLTERELDQIRNDAEVPFGGKLIRERKLVAARIEHDGRLHELTARGVLHRDGLRFDWQPEITDPITLIDYGLALLLDTSRPWGAWLCRCAWTSCNRFFWSEPPKTQGKRRIDYCSDECYRDKQASTAAERQRRHRAKLKQQQTKARKRR